MLRLFSLPSLQKQILFCNLHDQQDPKQVSNHEFGVLFEFFASLWMVDIDPGLSTVSFTK